MQRAQLLRRLVLDSQYVIDEHLIAAAILARAATRRAVAGASFRNDFGGRRGVRPFRPSSLHGSRDGRGAAARLGLI